jgi:ABC-type multidrug transport system ATPase subunit
MTTVISAHNLGKSFSRYHILEDVSLCIEPGTVYGLVGLNGAGKTTLLRLLLGILKPDTGTIAVDGHTPWRHPKELYKKCGVVLDNDGFWGNLTAEENCGIYASAKSISRESLQSYLKTYWNESDLFTGKKKVKHLSRGQRMQCALCRAFMGSPSVMFLDEPALALDLQAYDHFKRLVADARSNHAAIIISSHQLDTIDELCDRVGILRDGSITELENGSGKIGGTWFLTTGEDASVAALITQSGGEQVHFSDGWRFRMDNPDEHIPELIKRLVEKDIPVREIKQVEPGFGTAIRTLYAGTSERVQS